MIRLLRTNSSVTGRQSTKAPKELARGAAGSEHKCRRERVQGRRAQQRECKHKQRCMCLEIRQKLAIITQARWYCRGARRRLKSPSLIAHIQIGQHHHRVLPPSILSRRRRNPAPPQPRACGWKAARCASTPPPPCSAVKKASTRGGGVVVEVWERGLVGGGTWFWNRFWVVKMSVGVNF